MPRGLVLIPVHRDSDVTPFFLRPLAGRSSLLRTIDYARGLARLPGLELCIAVVTNDPDVAAACRDEPGIHLPERRKEGLQEALSEGLRDCEEHFGVRFDLVFALEPTHPFRPATLGVEAYDMIMAAPDLDSVVCAEQLHGRIWAGERFLHPLPEALAKDFYGGAAPFIELLGLLLVSRRHVVADGCRVGDNVGLVVVDRKWHFMDVRSEESLAMAECLAPFFHRIEGA